MTNAFTNFRRTAGNFEKMFRVDFSSFLDSGMKSVYAKLTLVCTSSTWSWLMVPSDCLRDSSYDSNLLTASAWLVDVFFTSIKQNSCSRFFSLKRSSWRIEILDILLKYDCVCKEITCQSKYHVDQKSLIFSPRRYTYIIFSSSIFDKQVKLSVDPPKVKFFYCKKWRKINLGYR